MTEASLQWFQYNLSSGVAELFNLNVLRRQKFE
jgi:hypothetical protein